MKTKMIIMEVEQSWVPAMCNDCDPKYGGICGISPCPLANAREAVDIQTLPRLLPELRQNTIDGKPVKLYAVEDK